MDYNFGEIHALNLLSDNPDYSKRFNTPKDLKIVTWLILLALAIVVAVAIIVKVDKIVPAKGRLDTKAELFEVRNTQQGFVSKVFFEEGEKVNAGDVLVKFDTRLLELDIQSLDQDIKALGRNLWSDAYQLNKVLSAADYNAIVVLLNQVKDPFSQLGWSHALVAPLEQTLAQLNLSQLDARQQAKHTQGQLILADQSLAMDEVELTRAEQLLKKGIESQAQMEQKQRQVLDSQSRKADLQSSLAQLLARDQQLNTDINKLKSDYVMERMVRFYDNLDRLEQTKINRLRQQRLLADMVVRAPISGSIDGVAIKGPGELLDANATLLTLRPQFKREDLVIEIQIPSSFAVWVEQGMEFRASAQGNNPDDHGYISGTVEFVSKSTTEDKAGARFFRIIGRITDFDLSARGLEPAFLRPGLELSVEIKAGQRRLINYIFDPFTKHFRNALKEPS
jgi:HlyD family type I secretion membrane fusion protein